MPNEKITGNPAEKPAEKAVQREADKSSGSSRPADGTAVGKPAFNWTWREYALQLSVVIIGIVVTFAGSGLIERWRVAREVRATMLLVHAELESDRADFMQVWDYRQWEMRACKLLTDNRRDLKRISSDTLASLDPVYGRIHFFHPDKKPTDD